MEVMHQDTKHTKIVEEITDEVFDQGYRFVDYVPNHKIDIIEMDSKREEETLTRMSESSSDPCYWTQVHVESGKCSSDKASDPIYHAPLEIY